MSEREVIIYPLYDPNFLLEKAGRRYIDQFESYLKEIPSLLTGGKSRDTDVLDDSSTLTLPSTLTAVDIETTGLYSRRDHLLRVGMYSNTSKPTSYRVKGLRDLVFTRDLFHSDTPKVVHNLGMESGWSYTLFGKELTGVVGDTMLMALREDPDQPVSLEVLASRRFKDLAGYKQDTKEALEKGQAAWIDPALLGTRNAIDCEATYRLYVELERSLGPAQMAFHREFDIPIASAVAKMAGRGLKLNRMALEGVQRECLDRMSRATENCRLLASNRVLSLRSHPQVREALQKLGAKTGTLTDKGLMSTAALPIMKLRGKLASDVNGLGALSPAAMFSDSLLDFRDAETLYSRYAVGLGKQTEAGFVYSDWRWPGTSTWRLSSSNPNLQNIPVRSALGRTLRRGFESRWPEGWLVEVDLSQIELRILACLSQDPNMVRILQSGGDLHGEAARNIFGPTYTPEQRGVAKAANFLRVYGGGWARLKDTLLEQAGMVLTDRQAMAAADGVDRAFPKGGEYMSELQAQASRGQPIVAPIGGYTTRPGPQLDMADGYGARNEIIRSAANFPVQCAGSILTLKALSLIPESSSYMPVAVVHDSILIDCVSKEVACEVGQMVRGILKGVCEAQPWFIVPADSEAKVGKNWGEMQKVA